jgi:hypothetical protein
MQTDGLFNTVAASSKARKRREVKRNETQERQMLLRWHKKDSVRLHD